MTSLVLYEWKGVMEFFAVYLSETLLMVLVRMNGETVSEHTVSPDELNINIKREENESGIVVP